MQFESKYLCDSQWILRLIKISTVHFDYIELDIIVKINQEYGIAIAIAIAIKNVLNCENDCICPLKIAD